MSGRISSPFLRSIDSRSQILKNGSNPGFICTNKIHRTSNNQTNKIAQGAKNGANTRVASQPAGYIYETKELCRNSQNLNFGFSAAELMFCVWLGKMRGRTICLGPNEDFQTDNNDGGKWRQQGQSTDRNNTTWASEWCARVYWYTELYSNWMERLCTVEERHLFFNSERKQHILMNGLCFGHGQARPGRAGPEPEAACVTLLCMGMKQQDCRSAQTEWSLSPTMKWIFRWKMKKIPGEMDICFSLIYGWWINKVFKKII